MPNPISANGIDPTAAGGLTRRSAVTAGKAAGDDFANMVREQLERVARMQSDADENVQKLLSGQSDNMTEVFVANRKAQVAFSLLMEIRNKLVDAYEEVKNLRV